ncbi:hypothetical protein BT93_L5522 [Corymbia citriodora subsp. variegata]|uniref:TIR domain-containing protein n=1 Tax=Corymbia citriodora subsp. variegata TaxID=360336 RepID=A0A8T0CS51_CORYI|nr:hypothetical protein BT93_L5522 [Corymbia citriodora subsp. variegata]
MSSYSRQWTPDVFVSFQYNEVAPERFTSTLFKQLKRAGIGYRDSHYQKDAGLLEPIRQARFALVVFSANYANSEQCLEELVKILLRRGDSKYPTLVVIPIFHGMDPAKVLEFGTKGEFKQALGSLGGKKKDEKKKEWRRALVKVEGIPGYELKKDANGVESELIKTIVKRLVNEIRSLYSHKVFGPFGGRGERSWHFDKINGIYVEYKDFIKSIKFDVKGNTKTEEQHGEKDGYRTYKVKLIDKEEEHITSFSGHFKWANNGGIRINSLTFETNKRILGPTNRKEEEKRQDKKEEAEDEKRQKKKEKGKKKEEAEEKEEFFSVPLPSDAGEVIEFFGSYGREKGDDFLTSIGARVKLLPPKKFCPVGLFGSRRGKKWDDGNRHTTVKGIRVIRDSSGNRCIQSIAFLYDKVDGNWSPHGGDAERPEEFIINDPNEYLSSISGYYTSAGITSLTFLTNKKRTNTIGHEKGTHFSSPATGFKIVGFYGWRDKLLHGIGAYFEPIPDLEPIKSFGPFGGGNAWDDGKFKGVKEIYIAASSDIRSIQFVYDDGSKNGCTIMHPKGVSCHSNGTKVPFHYPDEYLTSISGYMGDDGSIRSLTFDSNRERHGPYGKEEGEHFWYPSNGTKIIGFYGRWGKTLNSIGVYAESMPPGSPHGVNGARGVNGGEKWDDGKYTDVRGFRVIASGNKIESITFLYDNNGSLVEGTPHGGGDVSTGEWEMLNFPQVRLTTITGYSRKEGNPGQTIIHNLRIYTTSTKKYYGPYAERGDQEKKNSLRFRIPEKPEKGGIVGFFGRAGTHLNFIGAHLEP